MLRIPLCLAALAAALLLVGGPLAEVHFVDVAKSSGLDIPNTFGGVEKKNYILETTGTGVAIFDFDGDGRNDIFIVNGTTLDRAGQAPVTSQLYHNDGNGHFTEMARQAGITHEGWGQGVCVADYDNDGRPDMLVTYYGHNILYRNLGNGKFADVTAQAKLPVTGSRWGTGCAFLDYDRDGYVDLFVANYVDLDLSATPRAGANPNCVWKGLPVMCGPSGLPKGRNALFHNNRDGTFTDVSEQAGILKPGGRYALGVVAADFDNDGWPDIYVACDMTPSLLYHNRGDGTFEERGVDAGVAYNFDGRLQAGMGVAVADYDGNGFLDIAKSNFSGDLPSLYENEGGLFFNDVSQQVGLGKNQLLGWGIAFTDIDEDGWKDIVLANGHVYPEVDKSQVGDRYLQKTLLYRNLGNGRFQDITAEAGPAFQQARPARGLAVGDVDGDGRPEIVIVNMNEPPSLLKNLAPRRQFIRVRLVGTKSNRMAIGARVTLEAGGRTRIDEVFSGGSYLSQNEQTLHFGLGSSTMVDRIEVRWPTGQKQEWKRVPAGETVTLTEGQAEISAKPFPWNGGVANNSR
ncbi:MAG: CRTAC1 family protein [Bryobacteraceae bacterium]